MQIQTVGIIGYGHFGSFLHTLLKRFYPEIEVRIYSRHMGESEPLFVSLETAVASDLVFLCGAISEYEDQLKSVLAHTREDTILVDVATVKEYPTEIFKRIAGDRKWISTHPMFGAESYKKHNEDVTGFRIVITDYTLPNDTFVIIKNMLAKLGFVVIELSAAEHDRVLAETLFITHLLGQTVVQAGFTRTTMDTVSFSHLMDAAESIQQDTDLFKDVYRFNTYCKSVVDKLGKTQRQIVEKLQIS